MESSIKKKKNAFGFYLDLEGVKLREKGNFNEKQIISEMCKKYKQLSKDELEKYKKMEEEDKIRYDREIQDLHTNNNNRICSSTRSSRVRRKINYYESDQEDEAEEKSKKPKYSFNRKNTLSEEKYLSVNKDHMKENRIKEKRKSKSKIKNK